jgi:hypothetical protein
LDGLLNKHIIYDVFIGYKFSRRYATSTIHPNDVVKHVCEMFSHKEYLKITAREKGEKPVIIYNSKKPKINAYNYRRLGKGKSQRFDIFARGNADS